MVKCLSKRNLRVTVITPLFKDTIISTENSIRLKYIRLGISRKKLDLIPPIKILALLIFWIKSIPLLLRLSGKEKTIFQYHGTYCAPPAIIVNLFRRGMTIGDDIRLYSLLETRQVKLLLIWAYEISMLKLTSKVITSFAKDLAILRAILKPNKLNFLLNCIDDLPSKEKLVSKRENYGLFVGSMKEKENRQAIEELLNLAEILTARQIPLKILIIGGPAHFVFSYAVHPMVQAGIVRFMGYLPDEELKSLYLKSGFSFFPYFSAKEHTSQRIKVLESLGWGIPIIASSKAIDGFEGLVDNEHYFLAESIEDIANILQQYPPNSPKARAVGMRGRDYVESKFSFLRFCKNYMDILFQNI
ncbi:MAG: glycosyltransferase family 4 protein [Nitrososphaerales archaeon]